MTLDRRSFVKVMGAAAAAAAGGSQAAAQTQPEQPGNGGQRIRRIATEEAFATEAQFEAIRTLALTGYDDPDMPFWSMVTGGATPFARRVGRQLLDVEEERLAIMNEMGVDMHLLALTSPGVQLFGPETAKKIATQANDYMAGVIERHPGRFAGLVTVAPQDPAWSVREMERGIGELGLNGIMVNSHTDGEYLDQEKYWPILEAAEALNAPIYIHPRAPSPAMAGPYMEYGLANAIWGYGAEAGLHGMRLLVSGVLDRYPGTRIVLGHMGEGIPFWLWRVNYMFTNGSNSHLLDGEPRDYFKRNFAITTSGQNWGTLLDFCLDVMGPDNIMWAIDYPYQETPGAVEFLDAADIPEDVKAKIYHQNAERIFGLAG